MSQQLPIIMASSFILWLFVRDRKLRPMTSVALWIPLLWVIILGTRPISMWFASASQHVQTLDAYLEGSPFDRNIFIFLILAGLVVLIKRRIMLRNIFSENRLFFIFMILCGISCLWSDYQFTSLKRYIKDVGNVIMACIIITETRSDLAFKAILARYAYMAVTLSVLFIVYIPEFGRFYGFWSNEVGYCGIATTKNGLGQITFICGVFLFWDFLTQRNKDNYAPDKLDMFTRVILIAMVIWLISMAHSATSIVCILLGVFILLVLRTSTAKNQIHNLGKWTLGLLFFFVLIYTIPGALELLAEILGRDSSLTGRTELWMSLLAQPINPLIGVGYQSFWQTQMAVKVGEEFYFIPNQAHNGYLEVYIQTGLISLIFLIGAIFVSYNKLKKGLLMANTYSMLLITFFVIILIDNWTEASINKISILWFVQMIAILHNPNDSYELTS